MSSSSTLCGIIAAFLLLSFAAADPGHSATSHVFPPGFNVTTFNSSMNSTTDNILCGGFVTVMVGQGPVGYNGQNMPVFMVHIYVLAPHTFKRGIYNLRLNCGEFSSSNLILPWVFKRNPEGYCSVNGGGFIRDGGLVSFRYTQIMPQPLSVQSYDC